ncbi:MAG: rhomboid family intramembrane serine protease [Candidatus Levybacteria bacterium]|nr:rhomboid family intramembrane serine protease [Candidatus Levybacteria bacterium]
MFPLKDSIKATSFPFLNFLIVGITVYVFIQQLLAPDQIAFINQYALIPQTVNFSDYMTLIPFVTSIFLHGGILHILSNMWFLIVFGDNVNTRLSPIGFLLLYLTAGVVGGLAQYLFMPTDTIPMLGASGAVAGVLGCYAVLFPHAKIKTLVFIVFFVTIIEISALLMLGYWFALQLFSGVGSLGADTSQGGVAYIAHIGGFIVGLLFGFMNKNKGEEAGITHE